MTTRKGVVFVDFDGVFNALVLGRPSSNWEQATATVPEGSFKITWNPDVIDKFNSFSELDHVNVYWLTSWGSLANEVIAPLIGINEFKVLAEPPDSPDEQMAYDDNWWKLKAVKKFYETDDGITRYVWIDDDLAIEKTARQWCVDRRIYTIYPRPHVGLLTSDINHAASYFNPDRYNS